MIKKKISHLNKKNEPKIVDISKKNISDRIAIAQALIEIKKSSYSKINKLKTKKGSISNVAILAGIIGAKKTSELIPLCHNVPIENIDIDIKFKKKKLVITCKVKTSAKTGVEMEALTGVSIACLTIYDMCKSIDKGIIIKDIKLLSKSGGNSGSYKIKKNDSK